MFFLRLLGLLTALGLAVCLLSWALNGDRRYLRFAWRLCQVALAVLLLILGLLFFERLLVMV